jgi:hypothetical protein
MRFVIIGSARTGPTYLVGRLNRRKDVFCHQDVFHQAKPFRRVPKGSRPSHSESELTVLRQISQMSPQHYGSWEEVIRPPYCSIRGCRKYLSYSLS